MIKIRNEKGEYPCYLCPDTFHAKKDLRLHTINTHKDPSNLSCTYCQYEFKDISSVRRHIKTVHINVKEYLCSFCRKYYSHKYDLEQHFTKVHKNKPIVDNYRHCSECKALCLSWEELKEHLQNAHGKKIQHINCPFCMKIFFDPGYLKQHFKRVHPGNRTHSVIFCQECGKVYENSQTLISHTVDVHSWDLEEIVFCSKKNCEGIFKNKTDLAQHSTDEHGGGHKDKYQCPCCEEVFNEKVLIVAHITTVHSWDCVLECNKCNSWFKSGAEVEVHHCTESTSVSSLNRTESASVSSVQCSEGIVTNDSVSLATSAESSSTPVVCSEVTPEFEFATVTTEGASVSSVDCTESTVATVTTESASVSSVATVTTEGASVSSVDCTESTVISSVQAEKEYPAKKRKLSSGGDISDVACASHDQSLTKELKEEIKEEMKEEMKEGT